MPIRVPISLADIEIHFLDCCQMMGKLSTNFAMVPDSLEEFVSNLAYCKPYCATAGILGPDLVKTDSTL